MIAGNFSVLVSEHCATGSFVNAFIFKHNEVHFDDFCACLTPNANIIQMLWGSLLICPLLFFPLQLGPVEGVIFADYGTDLGSGPTVPGMCFVIS